MPTEKGTSLSAARHRRSTCGVCNRVRAARLELFGDPAVAALWTAESRSDEERTGHDGFRLSPRSAASLLRLRGMSAEERATIMRARRVLVGSTHKEECSPSVR